MSILTTIRWHGRDREELAARYAGNSSRAWNAVPRGVVPRPLRGASETLYWLLASVLGARSFRVDGDHPATDR